ncbi:MAG TPA: VWA domain-containing protein [Terriglobales bacterium]|nr:VWA domain-containing protein [Terriglobales bacterium]
MLRQSIAAGVWRGVLVCAVLLALTPSALRAQAPKDDQNEASVGTLKVQVDVVNVFFNVKDKKGLLIPNLSKDDFEIFEDGKPQTIKYFAAETDQPLTLGILIDTSPSQTRVLPMEQEVGAAFLNQVLRKKDLAFLISFDADVDLLQDFTSNTRELRAALNRTRIGGGSPQGGITSVPGIGQGPIPAGMDACCTHLYDAVYLAAKDRLSTEVGRKAMIILTDGEDEGSKVKPREAMEAAQKADSMVYVLLIADRGLHGMYQGFGAGEMKKLAEETGGRVIEVGNKFDKLKEAFDQVSAELRSQYNIGYTPTNSAHDGAYRKIELKSRQGYRVQARRGYYALAR